MAEIEVCDVCGSPDIKPFKCKLICQNCGAILRTCSDLGKVDSDIGKLGAAS
jgi:hypothetical protein